MVVIISLLKKCLVFWWVKSNKNPTIPGYFFYHSSMVRNFSCGWCRWHWFDIIGWVSHSLLTTINTWFLLGLWFLTITINHYEPSLWHYGYHIIIHGYHYGYHYEPSL